MAQIVPLDFSKVRQKASAPSTQSHPFDVVVFLDHFKSIDSLSDMLTEHFETDDADTDTGLAQTSLVFQSASDQLAITLGRRDS